VDRLAAGSTELRPFPQWFAADIAELRLGHLGLDGGPIKDPSGTIPSAILFLPQEIGQSHMVGQWIGPWTRKFFDTYLFRRFL
jgi:hypothetical protein